MSVGKQKKRGLSIIRHALVIGVSLFAAAPRAEGQLSMPSLSAGFTYQHATLFVPGNLPPVPIWSGHPGALRGWDASIEQPMTEWFGVRLNVSQQRGTAPSAYGCEAMPAPCVPTQSSVTNTRRTLLLGPTFSVKDGAVRLSGQVLAGPASVDARAPNVDERSYKSFAVQPGAGVELALTHQVALRVEGSLLSFGYRGPSATPFHGSETNAVLSTGLVVRLGARALAN